MSIYEPCLTATYWNYPFVSSFPPARFVKLSNSPWSQMAKPNGNGLGKSHGCVVYEMTQSGWWFQPLWKICQLGLLFPIYGKIKNVPNHQTAITMNRLPQKAEKTPRPCNWWPHSSHRSLQALLSSLVVAFQACELLQSRSHGHLVYHGLSLSVPHSNFGCPKPVPQFLKSTDFLSTQLPIK